MDIDRWITHILALIFTLALLGLVIYTVTGISDIELAKSSMGFAAGILGTIIGFYFNNARLEAEIRERRETAAQRDQIDLERSAIRDQYAQDIDNIIRRIEGEPED